VKFQFPVNPASSVGLLNNTQYGRFLNFDLLKNQLVTNSVFPKNPIIQQPTIAKKQLPCCISAQINRDLSEL
jgi:hypothetical protein